MGIQITAAANIRLLNPALQTRKIVQYLYLCLIFVLASISVPGETSTKLRSGIDFYPICVDAHTDTVGEGWGWQNGASCVVTEDSANNQLSTSVWSSCPANWPNAGRGFGVIHGKTCVVTNKTLGFDLEVRSLGNHNEASRPASIISIAPPAVDKIAPQKPSASHESSTIQTEDALKFKAEASLYADSSYTNSTPKSKLESSEPRHSWWQPKGDDNLSWYMQLQGDVNPEIDADVFFIDGDVNESLVNEMKLKGKRVMCYVSVGSSEDWRSDHSQIPPSVIGNKYDGWPGEAWLDIRNIEALAPILRARLDNCKAKGFDGVDADNVNGYANETGFNISKAESIKFIKWLARESHLRGLAFSLKNSEDIATELVDHVDMLQTESCAVYSNCETASVVRDANKPVFMVEYQGVNRNWKLACEKANQLGFSAILRDVLLSSKGIYRTCAAEF